ncbi:MAG: methylated-DNA--[protein]-cysteine S-methyltransferase [Planctomycetia bacterium]|nr:methylated-DNA--[protein]-cysteine S-methyltransferase [Planctomycetia bacterium]
MVGYGIVACRLGRLLVAGTSRGVSAVYLGDDDDTLLTELGREFGSAKLVRDPALAPWAKIIVRQLAGGTPAMLPLDAKGTAFQRRVWDELCRIPVGTTRSYTQVAVALELAPTAARAVARACATNPVSLLVPCHRVVRGDGSLGGYRWGLQRKRQLLDAEQAQAACRTVPPTTAR